MDKKTINKLNELYKRLEKLKEADIVVNAYGSFNVDEEVLLDFHDFVYKYYGDRMPIWVDAYFQLYLWQFQRYHEGLDTYYENLYGNTDDKSIQKAAKYLQKIGYNKIAKQLLLGISDNTLIDKIEKRIDNNQECIFKCYIDLLILNKNKLLKS